MRFLLDEPDTDEVARQSSMHRTTRPDRRVCTVRPRGQHRDTRPWCVVELRIVGRRWLRGRRQGGECQIHAVVAHDRNQIRGDLRTSALESAVDERSGEWSLVRVHEVDRSLRGDLHHNRGAGWLWIVAWCHLWRNQLKVDGPGCRI